MIIIAMAAALVGCTGETGQLASASSGADTTPTSVTTTRDEGSTPTVQQSGTTAIASSSTTTTTEPQPEPGVPLRNIIAAEPGWSSWVVAWLPVPRSVAIGPGDSVYFISAYPDANVYRIEDGRAVAVSEIRSTTPNLHPLEDLCQMTAWGDDLVLGYCRGQIVGYGLETGTATWIAERKSGPHARPDPIEIESLVVGHGSLYALGRGVHEVMSDGSLREVVAGFDEWTDPGADGGVAYALAAGPDGRLVIGLQGGLVLDITDSEHIERVATDLAWDPMPIFFDGGGKLIRMTDQGWLGEDDRQPDWSAAVSQEWGGWPGGATVAIDEAGGLIGSTEGRLTWADTTATHARPRPLLTAMVGAHVLPVRGEIMLAIGSFPVLGFEGTRTSLIEMPDMAEWAWTPGAPVTGSIVDHDGGTAYMAITTVACGGHCVRGRITSFDVDAAASLRTVVPIACGSSALARDPGSSRLWWSGCDEIEWLDPDGSDGAIPLPDGAVGALSLTMDGEGSLLGVFFDQVYVERGGLLHSLARWDGSAWMTLMDMADEDAWTFQTAHLATCPDGTVYLAGRSGSDRAVHTRENRLIRVTDDNAAVVLDGFGSGVSDLDCDADGSLYAAVDGAIVLLRRDH
ncbi:hypothetical protein HQ535_12795 [bacterium]|nr:hypothetical protein [bacterium]